MANNFGTGGEFEITPAEKGVIGILEEAAAEFKKGVRENLENAWDLLEQAQMISDKEAVISDETLCELAMLTERVVLECQSRGYFEENH